MSIPTQWCFTFNSFRYSPNFFYCIKDADFILIFLSVIATKYPKFTTVERGSMVFHSGYSVDYDFKLRGSIAAAKTKEEVVAKEISSIQTDHQNMKIWKP